MLFNSLDFAIFLPIVFILYWFVVNRSLKAQNFLIVCASYLFYGLWDWRFLFLIIFSSLLDFTIGVYLKKVNKVSKRKLLLWISIIVNLGFLGFFKYCNFFIDNFVETFKFFGSEIKPNTLNIILPVGISFYTFQTLSYTIDVYKRKLEPTTDLVSFLAFVSFFPQLVAGPIERATNLLPQFYKKRSFHYSKAVDGCKQILWGLFKKVVIADNCAEFADQIFNNYGDYSALTLLLGAVFFTFQIYGDFSGYSDIAIGTSKLFGFDLKQNFAFPYFSRDIAEFWRRWHISLSTWFRDYLYIPLGGSRGSIWFKIRNTFIIFLVSGFWHGANWTFVVWGFLNALYFLPLLLTNNNRKNLDVAAQNSIFPSLREVFQITTTFALTVLAWIFFRSESVKDALLFIYNIFSGHLFKIPELRPIHVFLLVTLFLIVEWAQRKQQYGIQTLFASKPKWIKFLFYFVLIISIAVFSHNEEKEFIYFQF